MLLFFGIFINQNRALWCSIILIPISLYIMLMNLSPIFFQRLLILVYAIVFIGGLLVILVRVASLLSYERILNFRVIKVLVPIAIFVFLFPRNVSLFKAEIRWVFLEGRVLLYSLILLLLALLVISLFSFNYQAIIRSL